MIRILVILAMSGFYCNKKARQDERNPNLVDVLNFDSSLVDHGAQEKIVLRANYDLKCVPDTVYGGDTLVITMRTPHGGDLTIYDPSGNEREVCYYQPFDDSPHRPLVQYKDFVSMGRLEIKTAHDSVYDARLRQKVLIFDESGWYLLRVGENLSTDVPYPWDSTRVYFTGTKRRFAE